MFNYLQSLWWQIQGKCKFCGNDTFEITTAQKQFDEWMDKRIVEAKKDFGEEYYYENIVFMPKRALIMYGGRTLKICKKCDRVVKWCD